jgi:hypothetical protein
MATSAWRRPRLHAVLTRPSPPGVPWVLTLPSPQHQDHLAGRNPGWLQIVDETVRLEDLRTLAVDLGSGIVCFPAFQFLLKNNYI